MSLKELKAKAKSLEPQIRIGKNGLSDAIINEIILQLKKKKLVKIKLLKAFLENVDKKEVCEEIARVTGSVIVEQTGNVVVLWRK